MKFSRSIEIKATPKTVFAIYKDVENWKIWDKDVEFSSLYGTFQTGAIGELKPINAPKSKIFFVEVTNDKSFTTMGKLPFCKMYFEHNIDTIDEKTVKVTHTVSFVGLLSPIFGKLIGKNIKQSLPEVLKSLKDKVEANKLLDDKYV